MISMMLFLGIRAHLYMCEHLVWKTKKSCSLWSDLQEK